MDAVSSSDILLFGRFRFDRRGGLLFRCTEDGRYQPVSVGSRALAVLDALTGRPGDLVTKDEIMRAAWAGTAAEEGNLTVQISTLRCILDAGSEGRSCIQTEQPLVIDTMDSFWYRSVPGAVGLDVGWHTTAALRTWCRSDSSKSCAR